MTSVNGTIKFDGSSTSSGKMEGWVSNYSSCSSEKNIYHFNTNSYGILHGDIEGEGESVEYMPSDEFFPMINKIMEVYNTKYAPDKISQNSSIIETVEKYGNVDATVYTVENESENNLKVYMYEGKVIHVEGQYDEKSVNLSLAIYQS